MLLPFQGAGTRVASHPGLCPGLCAFWAFSPPALLAMGGCDVGCGFLAIRLHTSRIEKGGCAVGRGILAIRPHTSRIENGLKAQQAPSPGQAERHPGYACTVYSFALKGQKHIFYGRPGVWCCGNVLMLCIYAFALSGRSYAGGFSPRALPWAMCLLGFQPAPLATGDCAVGCGYLAIRRHTSRIETG